MSESRIAEVSISRRFSKTVLCFIVVSNKHFESVNMTGEFFEAKETKSPGKASARNQIREKKRVLQILTPIMQLVYISMSHIAQLQRCLSCLS